MKFVRHQASRCDTPLTVLAYIRRFFYFTRRLFFISFLFNRGWDKLVAVLFHGSWTQESQHAVSILESLAHQQHQPLPSQQPKKQPQQQQPQQQQEQHDQSQHRSVSTASPATAVEPPPPSSSPLPTAPENSLDLGTPTKADPLPSGPQEQQRASGLQVLLAEANVMSLIDVRYFCRCCC